MDQTYMKEKPILNLLLSMSLPMVISMLVNSLYNIVDSYFVAKISEDAMTALSLVYPVQNLVSAVTIGYGIGINAVISFYLGAQDQKKTDRAAAQGILMSVIHGAVMTVGCIALMPAFLRMFTSDQNLLNLSMRYSRIVFGFSIIVALGLAYEKIFQAVGRMGSTMFCLMAGCIGNIILDPIMIFGLGPVPAMGIEGAALATGLGQTLTLALYLLICKIQPIPVHIRLKNFAPDSFMIRRLYAVGIPASLSLALPSILISALNAVLSAFSESYVLVLGIYYKLQTFLYLPASGIVQGMRPLVGYNYGAGEIRRVRKICGTALWMSALIMVVGTVLCLTVPDRLMGLFTSNAQTVQMGAQALRIISAGFIVSAVSVTFSGALEGLGMGNPSFAISLLRYIVIIIPAAFLLSRLAGAAGVWHAFWITEAVAAVFSWGILRRALQKMEKAHL